MFASTPAPPWVNLLEGAVQSQLRHSHTRMSWTLILISIGVFNINFWLLSPGPVPEAGTSSFSSKTSRFSECKLIFENTGGEKTNHSRYRKDILSCLHSQHCSKTRNTWAGEVRARRQTLSVISTAQMVPTIKSTGSVWFWHHSFLIAAAVQDAVGETKPGKPS